MWKTTENIGVNVFGGYKKMLKTPVEINIIHIKNPEFNILTPFPGILSTY